MIFSLGTEASCSVGQPTHLYYSQVEAIHRFRLKVRLNWALVPRRPSDWIQRPNYHPPGGLPGGYLKECRWPPSRPRPNNTRPTSSNRNATMSQWNPSPGVLDMVSGGQRRTGEPTSPHISRITSFPKPSLGISQATPQRHRIVLRISALSALTPNGHSRGQFSHDWSLLYQETRTVSPS